MSSPPPLVANRNEEAVSLDFSHLINHVVGRQLNPIDQFYSDCRLLVVRSSEVEPWVLRLMLLDLLSSTERYIRDVLSYVIDICPRSRDKASLQVLAIGAARYYTPHELGLAILENGSLAGADDIKKKIAALTGLHVAQKTSTDAALSSFEKICQLRHAIVHARGEIGFRNAVELGIAPLAGRREVSLTPVSLQPIVVVCRNVVRSLNNFIFEGILQRWMDKNDLSGLWDSDQVLVEPLCQLMLSKDDFPQATGSRFYQETILLHLERRG